MDYKFLVNKELEKFFDETDFSVGEILRTILSRPLTGIEITNKSRFQEITDQEWYEIIEKTFLDSVEDDPVVPEDEWDNVINEIFKDER